MCSRHAEPGAGAEYVERPYRALVETYDGDRFYLKVQAIGPQGAAGTAREVARDLGHDVAAVLKVEAA